MYCPVRSEASVEEGWVGETRGGAKQADPENDRTVGCIQEDGKWRCRKKKSPEIPECVGRSASYKEVALGVNLVRTFKSKV